MAHIGDRGAQPPYQIFFPAKEGCHTVSPGQKLDATNSPQFCVVGRRNDGSFVQALARHLNSFAFTLITEVEARDVARLIPQGARERIIMETDSQELVSVW
jgi:hypothetical protein